MPDHQRLFADCVALLDGAKTTGNADPQASALLDALGYFPDGGNDDPETWENRRALLALAQRMERVFTLPMPQAPGAHFCGAELAHAAFGLPGYKPATVGTGGRGETYRAAFESCMGETAAYLSFLMQNGDPRRAVEWDEASRHLPGEEALNWCLAGLGKPTDELPRLEWCLATSLDGHEPIAVPLTLCFRDTRPDTPPHRPALSNGVGCGPSPQDALLDALLEVVERDAAALWWYGGTPAAALQHDAGFAAWVRSIRNDGDRQTWFLDITTDLGIPVIAALSCKPEGTGIAAGFGAAILHEQAAKKALIELCQMELARELRLRQAREESTHRNDATTSHSDELRRDEHPAFLPSGETVASQRLPDLPELELCTRMLATSGYSAYSFDLTRKSLEIPCFRVIVPGLQAPLPEWKSSRLEKVLAKSGRPAGSAGEIPFLV